MSRLIASGWQPQGCVDRAFRECDPHHVPDVLSRRFVVSKWVITDPEAAPDHVRGLEGEWRIHRPHLDRWIRQHRGELLTPDEISSSLQGRRLSQRSYAEWVVTWSWGLAALLAVGLFLWSQLTP